MMNKREPVHVVLVADKPYWPGLEVTRRTLLEHASRPEEVVVHVFGEDAALDERLRRDFGTYKGSSLASLRLYLADLLPDVDWVVYTDVDTLWYHDVCALWALRDATKSIQWVRDIPSTVVDSSAWCDAHGVDRKGFVPANYACSGVCLLNLKRWRETDVLGRCRSFFSRYGKPLYPDQDALNYVLAREAGLLPGCWDVLIPDSDNVSWRTDGSPACVLHLTGVGRCFNRDYTGKVMQYRYWEYVAKGKPFVGPMRFWPATPSVALLRLLLPGTSAFFRDRVRRFLGYRWFFSRMRRGR